MRLSQIFIYPIKSARGIAVPETQVDTSGPLQDRRWMVVDEHGVFLSQRKLPRMVLIEPRFAGPDLVRDCSGHVTSGDSTVVGRWRVDSCPNLA